MGEYTAVAYQTSTGRVLYDIELASAPTWTTTLNGASDQFQVVAPLRTLTQRTQVREWAERWFSSVAILWNDQVVQAGPITQRPEIGSVDGMPVATVTGKGFWELLNQRLLHERSWNPATAPISDPSADLTLTDSLSNIAIAIATHGTTWVNRPGSALPLDLPTPDPAGGTNVRTYHGWDMANVGQRLQELTQVENGPDVFFKPYLTTISGVRYIRHAMQVGSPYLTQADQPLLFDLGASAQDIGVAADSSPMLTTAFVKGAGNEAGQLVGYSSATSLINLGWPALDFVDSSHSSASEQTTLDSWARADVAQFGRRMEQWKPRVLLDRLPLIGSYIPGHFARYVVNDHPWIPDGTYTSRILGISAVGDANSPAMVEHQIEAITLS